RQPAIQGDDGRPGQGLHVVQLRADAPDRLAPMRRRHVTLAVSAAAILGAGIAAGCGSQGVASPSPQTVQGSVPKETTPTTAKGNPANGKAVFASAGCGGCHRYAPAGTSANVGPDLDKLASYAQKANQPLASYPEGAIKA